MKSENNRAIFRKNYQQPNYWVKSVNLGLMIEPDFTLIKSKIQFIHNPNNTDTSLVLNGVDLELLQISVNGRNLNPDEYSIDKESLTIENVPTQFELQVENKIYPSKNTALGPVSVWRFLFNSV